MSDKKKSSELVKAISEKDSETARVKLREILKEKVKDRILEVLEEK